MYCPTCGAHLAQELSYCNYCGADLGALKGLDKARPPRATIDAVVWVIVGTTITILGMCLGALVLMNERKIDFALGTVFVLMSFVALVLVEGVLIWRLLRLNKGAEEARGLARPNGPEAVELGAARARALHEPFEPAAGITEQTTRALEHSYREGERR
jgi:hypothetical protein